MELTMTPLTLLIVVLYFVPTLIANSRGHPNWPAICALNVLLGWTVLGWVASFVWSLTAVRRSS